MIGKNTHNQAAPIRGIVAMKIKALIKMEASNDVFKPASEVVNGCSLNQSSLCRQPAKNS